MKSHLFRFIRHFLLILSIFLLVNIFSCKEKETPPVSYTEMDTLEYKVLSELIDSLYPIPIYLMHVFYDQTSILSFIIKDNDLNLLNEHVDKELDLFYPVLSKEFPSLQQQTKDDFRRKTKMITHLDSSFKLKSSYIFLDSSIFNWSFKTQYPNTEGWTMVSRVGFNTDKTQALVYIGHMCEPQSGTGRYFVLSLINGKWVLIHEKLKWIS